MDELQGACLHKRRPTLLPHGMKDRSPVRVGSQVIRKPLGHCFRVILVGKVPQILLLEGPAVPQLEHGVHVAEEDLREPARALFGAPVACNTPPSAVEHPQCISMHRHAASATHCLPRTIKFHASCNSQVFRRLRPKFPITRRGMHAEVVFGFQQTRSYDTRCSTADPAQIL